MREALGEPEFDIDGQVVRSGGVVDQIEENASKIDTLYQSHQNGGIRAKLSAPTVALITGISAIVVALIQAMS